MSANEGSEADALPDKQVKLEPPHKYVVEQLAVNLMCTLFVVDMEGQADGRALKTILPQINPRKLVRPRSPSREPTSAFPIPRTTNLLLTSHLMCRSSSTETQRL